MSDKDKEINKDIFDESTAELVNLNSSQEENDEVQVVDEVQVADEVQVVNPEYLCLMKVTTK